MQVLTALNTNPKLRNIFAYGIQDVHYTLDADGVVRKLNNDYDTPLEFTGNMFITYPPEGSAPNVWEVCKAQNLELVDDPYFGFFFDEIVKQESIDEIAKISEQYFAQLDRVSYAQFDTWVKTALAELDANPTIADYVSLQSPRSLAYAYNEWFFELFPNALRP